MELLLFNREQKITYYGKCKIVANSVTKFLIVTPSDENFEVIRASFDQSIIRENLSNAEAINDAQLKLTFQERFIQPIIAESQKNNSLQLKELIRSMTMSLSAEQREKYLAEMDQTNNTLSSEIESGLANDKIQNKPNLRKRSAKEMIDENEDDESEFSCLDSQDSCFESDNIDSDDEKAPIEKITKKTCNKRPVKKRMKKFEFNCGSIIEASNFKILNYNWDGKPKSRLFIFPTSDRKVCYDYFWFKQDQCYICQACRHSHKKDLRASLEKRFNGGKYIKLSEEEHACELVKYEPEKYGFDPEKQILKSSQYQIFTYQNKKMLRKTLFVFPNYPDKNLCYEYGWSKSKEYFVCRGCRLKAVCIASIRHKSDGTEYLRLNTINHKCELRKYDPEKYKNLNPTNEILDPQNFKIFHYTQNNVKKSNLFIFNSADQTTGYDFYWTNTYQKFRCSGCHNKNKTIAAKIIQNSKGEDCIELNIFKHVCEPRVFKPDNYKSDLIFYKPDYQIVEQTVYGKTRKKILIVIPENKELCYEYLWDVQKKIYKCTRCIKSHIFIKASIYTNEDGKEFVTLQNRVHACKPLPFLPEKYKASQIIRKPDYHLLKRKYQGRLLQRLVIFNEKSKKLCYEYTRDHNTNNKNNFYCTMCNNHKKLLVYAKLVQPKNGKEEYVELANKQHECEPIKYVPEKLETNIVKQPDFKIEPYRKSFDDDERNRIVIFDTADRNLCYIYYYLKTFDFYYCSDCSNHPKEKTKGITAKILQDENGEDYLELSDNTHICQPKKYEPVFNTFERVYPPNFKFKTTFYQGQAILNLVINHPTNKNLCYIYRRSRDDVYYCYECKHLHKFISAKLRKNENGNDYLELCRNEHVCKPQRQTS